MNEASDFLYGVSHKHKAVEMQLYLLRKSGHQFGVSDGFIVPSEREDSKSRRREDYYTGEKFLWETILELLEERPRSYMEMEDVLRKLSTGSSPSGIIRHLRNKGYLIKRTGQKMHYVFHLLGQENQPKEKPHKPETPTVKPIEIPERQMLSEAMERFTKMGINLNEEEVIDVALRSLMYTDMELVIRKT